MVAKKQLVFGRIILSGRLAPLYPNKDLTFFVRYACGERCITHYQQNMFVKGRGGGLQGNIVKRYVFLVVASQRSSAFWRHYIL